MRIDQLLVRLRYAKSRSLAQARIGKGHMRCNGQRITRLDHAIGMGDVITMPLGPSVRVIEILSLPHRRGPPSEAQACYRVLDAGAPIAIADRVDRSFAEGIEGNTPQ
ncbi:S4 domain-containing protein [Alteraurantiacibacter aquimixticola]|uniref:RNA-binding S4 domain-containing protein n=1 Tax=Alteraurantiacibacter aquimixticola TaxID=2489173 RepID=A0A4T3F1C2_9SPHN|nr:S4 domain-containing protein [Alteraurantiacibacter aquimixticola]TIX49162.1 RNA-binding S4 domain-containing protein [Alteraurantiacibacter aquimixticola]